MSSYRRSKTAGATYFFTLVTNHRQPHFRHALARDALGSAIREVQEQSPFQIEALVLLPDHLHAIWTLPVADRDYSTRWSRIKRLTAKACAHLVDHSLLTKRQIATGEIGFWQRRFWEHQIRDDADFAAHIDYLHWNPVKHGLVDRVGNWPHSTFHRYFGNGTYSADWAFVQRDAASRFGE